MAVVDSNPQNVNLTLVQGAVTKATFVPKDVNGDPIDMSSFDTGLIFKIYANRLATTDVDEWTLFSVSGDASGISGEFQPSQFEATLALLGGQNCVYQAIANDGTDTMLVGYGTISITTNGGPIS